MNDEEKLEMLRLRIEKLEQLVKKLIKLYDEHWHDAGEFDEYGLATYSPKDEFLMHKGSDIRGR